MRKLQDGGFTAQQARSLTITLIEVAGKERFVLDIPADGSGDVELLELFVGPKSAQEIMQRFLDCGFTPVQARLMAEFHADAFGPSRVVMDLPPDESDEMQRIRSIGSRRNQSQ